ncbi:MAG: hypothetical protein DDG60_12565 [Anaerolineae bacterium]|nr:MAG: hypothetical protein DDG60_12565 [Anaerolineae bacterium]
MKPLAAGGALLVLLLLCSACNLSANTTPTPSNLNVVFTAAAQTVEAKLTQSALLVTLTPLSATALPTATISAPIATFSTSTPSASPATAVPLDTALAPCDAARFVADVTVPDGTPYAPGTAFVKTWRLKNIGTCTWNSSYSLVFDAGDVMGGPSSLPLPGTVAPGEEIDISISLIAPVKAGKYRGYWRLQNPTGQTLSIEKGYNGRSFFVEIQVKPTGAADASVKFAVTSVAFSVQHTGTCSTGKYTVTATITVNKPGTVTYSWIRSDGATGPAHNGSLEFTQAGSQAITFEWATGASGLWVDLYIDEPNHQQFGRALLNCP